MKQEIGKSTGFRCWNDELCVGDLLSVHSGYDGFRRVIEKEDGFWLVDWNREKGWKSPIPVSEWAKDERLTDDITAPYRKVDPNDPYREPPFALVCDQCLETVVGYFDVEAELEEDAYTWTEECGFHAFEERGKEPFFQSDSTTETVVVCRCKACVADPNRISKTRELQDYFEKRYAECPVKTIHHPVFHSKEDIDKYIENLKKMSDTFDRYWSVMGEEQSKIIDFPTPHQINS